MGWSYKLGEYFGIEVRLHATFLLLIGWLVLATWSSTGSLALALGTLVFLSIIFGCVVFHEYGHALMARRFGIGTKGITLLPIGGVAELERMPSDPRQELAVALAGPAVNFALAAIASLLLFLQTGSLSPVVDEAVLGGSLLSLIVRVNLFMGVFNLLPALPMDGGRVLRALLATRMPNLEATRRASTVARFVAAVMVLWGIMSGRLMLALIGAFVWMASGAELGQAEMRNAEDERRGRRRRPTDFIDADFVPMDDAGRAARAGPEVGGPPADDRRGANRIRSVELLGIGSDGRPRYRVVRREA